MKLFRLTFFVALVAFVICSCADAQITSQFREVFVRAQAQDASLDVDDVVEIDTVISLVDGMFDDAVDVIADTTTGTTTATSNQLSGINGQSFFAGAEVETFSIEDGDSSNIACALFEFDFELPVGGIVDLSQFELFASRAQLPSQARSDATDVSLVIIDTSTDATVFDEVIFLAVDDESASGGSPQQVDLPPGSFQLSVLAEIRGDDLISAFQGQPRGTIAQFQIEGTIIDAITGDINGDGAVNLLDVGPFVDRISAGTYSAAADINGDGQVDLLDVGPFIALLNG